MLGYEEQVSFCIVSHFSFLIMQKEPDYIGCISHTPTVTLLSDKSDKRPSLEWFVMKQGSSSVARILAAFELIQVQL